jgi:hypothetical protein
MGGVGAPPALIAPAPVADAVDGVPGQGVQCPMLLFLLVWKGGRVV